MFFQDIPMEAHRESITAIPTWFCVYQWQPFLRTRKTVRVITVYASDCTEDLETGDVGEDVRESIGKPSPCGVLEDRFSESETSSSEASTSYFETPTVPNIRSPRRRLKSIKRFPTFLHVGIPKLWRRGNKQCRASQLYSTTVADFGFLKPSWRQFTISELKAATNSFSPENIIGMGGYSEVYKGCLEDGKHVAIKRLTRGTSNQQASDLFTELGILIHIFHPNIAQFLGFGAEGGMHLVFQLSPRGSLASLLHGPKEKLEWSVRYKVALGTAKGIEYLHEKSERRIIHLDIKAANIVLAEDFEPRICDFGLARWLPDEFSQLTMSMIDGTFGYVAPEYLMHGTVDEKTDVFAFGVLLLELITGRKALDSSYQSLVMWAKPSLENNNIRDLVDPSLGDAYDHTQLNRAVQAASMCTRQSSDQRPRMSQVLKLLKGEERRTSLKELLEAEE